MKTTPRKTQVLNELQAARGQWVNGPELANERVGGSEGLKRLRELRAEGYPIQERRHPDPKRTIWQYRLVPAPKLAEARQMGLFEPCCDRPDGEHGSECPNR